MLISLKKSCTLPAPHPTMGEPKLRSFKSKRSFALWTAGDELHHVSSKGERVNRFYFYTAKELLNKIRTQY